MPEQAGSLSTVIRALSAYILTRRYRTLVVACVAESLRKEFRVGACKTLFQGILRLKGMLHLC